MAPKQIRTVHLTILLDTQYTSAQGNSANNIRIVFEAQIGTPGQSENDVNDQALAAAASKRNTISAATAAEARNHDVTLWYLVCLSRIHQLADLRQLPIRTIQHVQ